MLRRIKGQPFPNGFDEWCELSEVPPSVGFESHESFSGYVKRKQLGEMEVVAEPFISSVTEEGRHWSFVGIDPSPDYREQELKFKFSDESDTGEISKDNTHAWRFQITGVFKLLEFTNAKVRLCQLRPEGETRHIRLVNCVIGKLEIEGRTDRILGEIVLELYGCWVGTLVLKPGCLKKFTITGGSIAQIECPPSDSRNPFAGDVSFKNVFLPSSLCDTKLFRGPHSYRSLYAHLKKLDNTLMANQMRSHQLRSERVDEHGSFAKFSNWVYDTFADYGMKPGRPVLWILGAYVLAVIYCYNFDYGTLVQSTDTYVGTYAILLDENGGRLIRSFLLPFHSIINPFGVFFDSRKLFIPMTGFGSLLLTIQGLFSDILLVMTALSIRRRFKAE